VGISGIATGRSSFNPNPCFTPGQSYTFSGYAGRTDSTGEGSCTAYVVYASSSGFPSQSLAFFEDDGPDYWNTNFDPPVYQFTFDNTDVANYFETSFAVPALADMVGVFANCTFPEPLPGPDTYTLVLSSFLLTPN